MPIGVLSSYNILPIILKLLVITLELFLGFSESRCKVRTFLCRVSAQKNISAIFDVFMGKNRSLGLFW